MPVADRSATGLPEQHGAGSGADQDCPDIVEKAIDCPSLFYIGRGLDHALALEGSLKLKELSYLHSEAYAAR